VVQTLMDLHGAGLAAMLESAAGAEGGAALIDAWVNDDLIASLLLLYGLHPLGVEQRTRAALEQVQPLLRAHGCVAELLGVTNGAARLRLTGGSEAAELIRTAVTEAITAAAPDLTALAIDGPDGAAAPSRLVPLPLAGR
jgi:hypothetical protein